MRRLEVGVGGDPASDPESDVSDGVRPPYDDSGEESYGLMRGFERGIEIGRVDGRRWGRARTFSARVFICPVAGERSRGGSEDVVWDMEETVT